MLQLEELEQAYLFKLRQTAGVKQLIKRRWRRQDWSDMGQGWSGCADELRLSGWSTKRRVIVMRRQRKTDLVLEQKNKITRIKLSCSSLTRTSLSRVGSMRCW